MKKTRISMTFVDTHSHMDLVIQKIDKKEILRKWRIRI